MPLRRVSRVAARRAVSALVVAALVPPALAAGAADPFADEVVSFEPGVDGNPAYADPLTTLGSPERFTGEGIFEGVVSVFNPAYGTDELVSIGRGGALVVRFDEPVTDDPRNPFGIDLIVFGNTGFVDASYPQGIVGGLFGADGGAVEVSADGVGWVAVPDVSADGMLPTVGYLDAGPYDEARGTDESDFTRPADPALTLADLEGLDNAQVLERYDLAGGGAGIDLAVTGLDAISYVRVVNPPDAETDIEIEAFADVAPGRPGDVDGDGAVDVADLVILLSTWGSCPDPPDPCPADLDGDGAVSTADLVILLADWGP